ncbi:conserved hypothetical protein [Parafrankia sp. Ea1.12]|nr:conserved hypothetical protein [Parafrankia sp. Ea1.12]
MDNLRHLLDVVAGVRPPSEVVTQVADQFARISARLAPFTVPESARATGLRLDLPGRGQTMAPASTRRWPCWPTRGGPSPGWCT